MHLSRRTRLLSLALAAGCAPLLLALALHGQPGPKILPPKATPPAVGSPLFVAQALDTIVQARFQDDSAMVFGGSRVGPVFVNHVPVSIAAQTPQETDLLKSVDTAHRDYVISLLHCAPIPPGGPRLSRIPQKNYGGLPQISAPQAPPLSALGLSNDSLGMLIAPVKPTLRPLIVHSHTADSLLVRLVEQETPKAALSALPRLRLGQDARAYMTGWTLLMRPIPAAQTSCLSCHTTAKRGETLGVMVYAVSNTVNKSENVR